jgi:hypothetical protein
MVFKDFKKIGTLRKQYGPILAKKKSARLKKGVSYKKVDTDRWLHQVTICLPYGYLTINSDHLLL